MVFRTVGIDSCDIQTLAELCCTNRCSLIYKVRTSIPSVIYFPLRTLFFTNCSMFNRIMSLEISDDRESVELWKPCIDLMWRYWSCISSARLNYFLKGLLLQKDALYLMDSVTEMSNVQYLSSFSHSITDDFILYCSYKWTFAVKLE